MTAANSVTATKQPIMILVVFITSSRLGPDLPGLPVAPRSPGYTDGLAALAGLSVFCSSTVGVEMKTG